ncbi:coiled-coil domain-containing protein 55-domain containing protein [Immersiella caudata]|uniref:Coiled-coil domain-containing protein 55-domain containing protein n=1 Tax=Immersiella caudata TaxID=314043 RepID=A0AA39WXQ3_9PEZI|nr:coiled-coil domain-containing protein 55-domain containing protein [Immersiella caudata]
MSKPAFSFGLKKAGPAKPAPAKRKPTTFGDASDDDDDQLSRKLGTNNNAMAISELDAFDSSLRDTTTPVEKPNSKLRAGAPPPPPPTKAKAKAQSPALFGDLSSALESRKYADAVEGADPSIYDYDGVYDSLKAAAHASKKAEEEDTTAEKKPRYFDALQRAADVRERDRQIAEEKRLKRERDAEGEEFADKEKFVTEAYKRQQKENRRLEEEEKLQEEAEAKKNKNRGLADFYKQMLDKGEEKHAAMVKAVEEGKGKEVNGGKDDGEKEKTATDRAREINAMGGNIIINDDGEVVDKRQLLKGGLNVTAKKKAEVQKDKSRQTAHGTSTAGIPSRGIFKSGGKNAMRERQTRMLEAQLEETLKRSREEEEQEQAKVEMVAKSRKTEADISSAKERYLARKRAAEEAKKNATQ